MLEKNNRKNIYLFDLDFTIFNYSRDYFDISALELIVSEYLPVTQSKDSIHDDLTKKTNFSKITSHFCQGSIHCHYEKKNYSCFEFYSTFLGSGENCTPKSLSFFQDVYKFAKDLKERFISITCHYNRKNFIIYFYLNFLLNIDLDKKIIKLRL